MSNIHDEVSHTCDVVLPQRDGEVLDVLVLDAVAGRHHVLVVHQNSAALKIFQLNYLLSTQSGAPWPFRS